MSTATKFKLPVKLTQNFSVREATFSQTADRYQLNNKIPNQQILNTCIHTAQQMELVRELLGSRPIHVSSWYRSIAVNRAVGSKSDSSQHTKGEAVDFDCDSYGSPLDICKAIILSNISFDQLILEHSWVHISFKIPSSRNRKQVLSLLRTGKYAQGLTNKSGRKYVW